MSDWMAAAIESATEMTGRWIDANQANNARDDEYQRQKEFAKEGIRWRVADAKAAGIHPLYALGAAGSTYSPTTVIGGGMGEGLRNVGQNIGRAIRSGSTREDATDAEARSFMLNAAAASDQRMAARELHEARIRLLQLQADGQQLDNLTRAQGITVGNPIAPVSMSGGTAGQVSQPAFPSARPSGKPQYTAAQITQHEPGVSSRTAGINPSMTRYQTKAGQINFPSKEISEPLETIPGAGLGIMLADYFGGLITGGDPPKMKTLPGHTWQWSVWDQQWKQVRTGGHVFRQMPSHSRPYSGSTGAYGAPHR